MHWLGAEAQELRKGDSHCPLFYFQGDENQADLGPGIMLIKALGNKTEEMDPKLLTDQKLQQVEEYDVMLTLALTKGIASGESASLDRSLRYQSLSLHMQGNTAARHPGTTRAHRVH